MFSGRERDRENLEKARRILHSELSQQRTDGTPVSHRRLESLMLAVGAEKRQTMCLLRAIGARPSNRDGGAMWTLKPNV
jgi:hypothetical protein